MTVEEGRGRQERGTKEKKTTTKNSFHCSTTESTVLLAEN
jgi:hypothetical protein